MTSFQNDETNPYGRASVWPKMPQAPFRVGGLPMGAPLSATPQPRPAETPQPAAAPPTSAAPLEAPTPTLDPALAPAPMVSPVVASIAVRPPRPAVRRTRLTPLIGAAAVGAGGVLALVLLFGLGVSRAPAPAAPAPAASSALAVGALIGVGETPGRGPPQRRPFPRLWRRN